MFPGNCFILVNSAGVAFILVFTVCQMYPFSAGVAFIRVFTVCQMYPFRGLQYTKGDT